MSEPTELKIDKSTWGEGLWQHEPDRLEFEHLGFPCLITRHPSFGHLCGYIAVPPGHPYHGKHYDDDAVKLYAHGSVNYSDRCFAHICHVPKPGEPDNVWWFGFDCGHAMDYSPALEARMRGVGVDPLPESSILFGPHKYRHMVWVQDEIKALAEQLAKVAPQNSL